MSEPTTDQLVNLVNISNNIGELDVRVGLQFGDQYIDRARLIAVQVNGARWVFAQHVDPGSPTAAVLKRTLSRPSTVAMYMFCIFGIGALLWPPYSLIVEGSIAIHTGFQSIFSGALGQRNTGSINSVLLTIELLSISAVGTVSFIVASRIDRALGRAEPRTR